MARDVRDSIGHRFADDESEQTPSPRRRTDRGALSGGDAARDESLDATTAIDDSQRSVSRVDELPDAVDDQLKDAIEVQLTGDRAGANLEGIDRRQEVRISFG